MNPLVKSRFEIAVPEAYRNLNIAVVKKKIKFIIVLNSVIIYFQFNSIARTGFEFFLALIQLSKHFYNRMNISTGQQCDH